MKSLIKTSLSSILVVFFFLILLFLSLFAEVFESQTPQVDLAQIYSNPIPVNDIAKLKSLVLTNKNGEFKFENMNDQGDLYGPWQMTSPQSLKAKSDVITKIVNTLKVVRVRNFHRLEPINITSFSLDNPTMTLKFINTKDRQLEIKMGLINPIDNSAYLSLSTQNQIYQIDPLEITLESYDIAQLVESKVLALNSESLVSLEIYGKNGLDLKILRKENLWFDQNGQKLSDSKVEKFISRIEDIKGQSILNNLNPEQKEFMQKTQNSPTYLLKIITSQGVRSYVVGDIQGNIPGITQNNNNLFALSSEDKESFVLIEKDQLRILNTKSNELK